MKIYGLIGNPLTHSFSQRYFREKFTQQSIEDCDYINFEVENLQEQIPVLRSNKLIAGLNITIPHKTSVLPYIDNLTPTVEAIGACNCIRISSEIWTGFNTDVKGFELSLKEKLRAYHIKALIIGTGGSAKAVSHVLTQAGIDHLYVSRSQTADGITVLQYPMLTPEIFQEYKLVINTTPLGMYPMVHRFPDIPYQFLTPAHYCYDLVYNPQETIFLQKAREKGAIVKNGYDMLVIQAEESWKIWNS